MQATSIGWGAPRIHGELLKLGIDVSQATVSKYMLEVHPPPTQTFESSPRYLLRDRDAIYGELVLKRINSLGIKEILIAPRSPWQNPFVERVIGSIRRDCLDRIIVINEMHLRQVLADYLDYYHSSRTHLSLNKDPPMVREVEQGAGQIIGLPKVGGLHHQYVRAAA